MNCESCTNQEVVSKLNALEARLVKQKQRIAVVERNFEELKREIKKQKTMDSQVQPIETDEVVIVSAWPDISNTTQNDDVRVKQFKMSTSGDAATVTLKLVLVAGVNDAVLTGKAPVHYAVENSNVKACEHLLRKGAEVNVCENTKTPLHVACSNGHLPLVKLLMSYGANVNLYTSDFLTPLHCAVQNGHLEVGRYLLSNRANVNAVNEEKMTLLHEVAREGNLSAAQMLVSYKAAVNLRDFYKCTPLHFAAQYGYAPICEYLLQNGAIVNVSNNNNNTPLELACREGHYSVVRLLVSNGAASQNTLALHHAAQHGHLAICQYLLGIGAPINALNASSNTPLQLAAYNEHLPVVKLLVVHGASFKPCDRSKTFLCNKTAEDHTSVCEYLNEISN